MMIYSDQLLRQMANSVSVFVIFNGKTETAFKQEEKLSFPLSSVVGFPVLVLFTLLYFVWQPTPLHASLFPHPEPKCEIQC